jgi:alkylhydroperoxidase family enzyme
MAPTTQLEFPKLLARDPGQLAQLAPGMYQAMATAWHSTKATLEPEVLELIWLRVTDILEGDSERSDVSLDAASVPAGEAIVKLTDQFVDSVADVDEEHLAGLRESMSAERLKQLLEAMYVVDQLTRLYITHTKLFGTEDSGLSEPEPTQQVSLADATWWWHHKALELHGIDPTTSEVARLRGAVHHNCRLCASLRAFRDDAAVVDEPTFDRIRRSDTGSLPRRHQLALTYADAHMIDPGALDQPTCDALRAEFSHAELLAMSVEMSAWNLQKVLVPLKLDEPVRADGLSKMIIKEDGTLKIGGALTEAT